MSIVFAAVLVTSAAMQVGLSADEPVSTRPLVMSAPDAPSLTVAGLQLGEPVETAFDTYGEPSHRQPDIFGSAHQWQMEGDARLVVSAWDDGAREITGLSAEATPSSPVTLTIYDDIVIGDSTLQEVIDDWGRDYVQARHEGSDYVIAYDRCAGPHPVIVKFDQETADGSASQPLRMSEPVTRVLIAYADADAAIVGCATGQPSTVTG